MDLGLEGKIALVSGGSCGCARVDDVAEKPAGSRLTFPSFLVKAVSFDHRYQAVASLFPADA